MALKKCSGCGRGVSKRAAKCPSCGEPVHNYAANLAACGCLVVLVPVAAIFCAMVLCSGILSDSTDPPRPVANPEPAVPEIPNDVKYTVIEGQIIPGVKRSLEVHINRRVSEDVLRSIALKLKNSDPKKYDRTFIEYYLPDVTDCWATTHFNPSLEVRFLGTTEKEHERLAQEAMAPIGDNVIGRWMDNETAFPGVITFLEEDGKVFKTKFYADGGTDKYEMVVQKVGTQTRYRVKGSEVDYMVINANGDLAHGDANEGLWATSTRIEQSLPSKKTASPVTDAIQNTEEKAATDQGENETSKANLEKYQAMYVQAEQFLRDIESMCQKNAGPAEWVDFLRAFEKKTAPFEQRQKETLQHGQAFQRATRNGFLPPGAIEVAVAGNYLRAPNPRYLALRANPHRSTFSSEDYRSTLQAYRTDLDLVKEYLEDARIAISKAEAARKAKEESVVEPKRDSEDTKATPWRTWTTADGKYTVEAKFIKYAAGTLTLEKKDGTTVDVELDRLCPEDQDFIKERKAKSR